MPHDPHIEALARDVTDVLRDIAVLEIRVHDILKALLALNHGTLPAPAEPPFKPVSGEPVSSPVDAALEQMEKGLADRAARGRDATARFVSGDPAFDPDDPSVVWTPLNMSPETSRRTTGQRMDLPAKSHQARRYENDPGYQARRETILSLWATTNLNQAQIGERVNRDARTVRAVILKARRAGDPRAVDRVHHTKLSPATSAQGVSRSLRKDATDPAAGDLSGTGSVEDSAVSNDPTNAPVKALDGTDAAVAETVSAAPAGETSQAPSSPAGGETKSHSAIAQEILARRKKRNSQTPTMAFLYDEPISVAEEAKPEPEEELGDSVYGTIGLLVDVKGCQIHGPKGDARCEKHVARVIAHMADGGHYPVQELAKRCGIDKALVTDVMAAWKGKLEQIGIGLTVYGGLYSLQRLGA